VIRSNRKVLSMLTDARYFECTDKLVLEAKESPEGLSVVTSCIQKPLQVKMDDASVIIEEDGKVYRIPKNPLYQQEQTAGAGAKTLGIARVCREVATERDLFNLQGTFYELPARNAQGFAKIRSIATHNLKIHDYASHFGLLFMTGLNGKKGDRIITSSDGEASLWVGTIDDLWKLGKPRGVGGVWNKSPAKAGVPSDPYLMTGYDKKSARLQSSVETQITLEVDVDGTQLWVPVKTFDLKAGEAVTYDFPEGFSAYWVRAISSQDATATVLFDYE
jgi:hypothetical protein